MLVEHDERRAGRQRIGDRAFAAELAAQQARQLIGALARERRIGELEDFPRAVGTLQGRGVGAAEHALIRYRRERPAI